jgi:hypothetical protein
MRLRGITGTVKYPRNEDKIMMASRIGINYLASLI